MVLGGHHNGARQAAGDAWIGFSPELRCRTLGHLGGGPCLGPLLAARAAGRACRRAAAPLLRSAICCRFLDSDWAVRLRAVGLLARLSAPGLPDWDCLDHGGGGSETEATAIVALVEDEDGRVREAAVNALGRLPGAGDAAVVLATASRLGNPSPFVRTAAGAALAVAAARGDQHLAAAARAAAWLEHEDAGVRASAAEAMARVAPAEGGLGEVGVRPLIARLGDVQAGVRHAALQALRKVAPLGAVQGVVADAVVASIAARLQGDTEVGVRQAAAMALGHLSERGSSAAVTALSAGLADSAWAVRKAAAESLAAVAAPGDTATAAVLSARSRLTEEHSLVRRAADEASSRILGTDVRRTRR